MAYFKLELLTPNIVFSNDKNYGNITYFRDTISEFDINNNIYQGNTSSDVIDLSIQPNTNFTYTYNEKFSIHQNNQKDLTFSLNLKTFSHNNWVNNPFADLLHVGSKLLLTDKYQNTYIFNITKIDYKPSEINTELNFTCQDTFSYQLSRQNNGYTIKNDETSEDFIGARTLDYWAIKIAQECHVSFANYLCLNQGLCRLTLADGSVEYHVTNSFDNIIPNGTAEIVDFSIIKPIFPKPTDLDNTYADYYEEIPFAVSNSTANAALIALGNELAFNLSSYDIFDEVTKQQKSYFWFLPAHNDKISGLTYSPYKNIQSFSFGNSGDALTTVLNVDARKLSDDSLVTMLPEVNGFFTQYFLDTEWENSIFTTGMFSEFCQGKTQIATTDESFENAYLIATSYQETIAPENFRNLWYNYQFGVVSLNNNNYICIPCYQNSFSPLFHTPKWYSRINFRTHNSEVASVLENAASHISFNTFGIYFDINTVYLGLFSGDASPELLYLMGEDNNELPLEARDQDYFAAILIPTAQYDLNNHIISQEENIGDIINYHIYFNWNRIPSETELAFAEIADQAPWLENKIIDFSYFVKQKIINKNEYQHLIDMIYNELRIVNGQLLVYYKSYVAAVQAKTKIVAEVLNSFDALGAALQADVIDVYATKGKLEDISYFNQAYNTVLENQKQNKTLFNLPSLLEEYFRKYFNAQQRFLKNISRFKEYFNAPVSFGKEGTAIYQHRIGISNNELPTGTTNYAFLTFPNAQFRTLPADFQDWINDLNSFNYGQPYTAVYYKNISAPVKIVTKDTLANYYLPLIRQDEDLLSCVGQAYSAKQSYYYKEGTEWKQAEFDTIVEHYLNNNNYKTQFYIKDQEYKSINSSEPYLQWPAISNDTIGCIDPRIFNVLCRLAIDKDITISYTSDNLAQVLFDQLRKTPPNADNSYVYAQGFPLANVFVRDYKYNITNGVNLTISVLNQDGLTYQQWYDLQLEQYPGETPTPDDFTNSLAYYPVSLVTPNNYQAFYHRCSSLNTQKVYQQAKNISTAIIQLYRFPSVENWLHMTDAVNTEWATEGGEWVFDFYGIQNSTLIPSSWNTFSVWNDCKTLNHIKSEDAYDTYQLYAQYFTSHQGDPNLRIGENLYQNNVQNWATFYNLTGWTYNTLRSQDYQNVFYYQPKFWRILGSNDIVNNQDNYYFLPIYMNVANTIVSFDDIVNNQGLNTGVPLYTDYEDLNHWLMDNRRILYNENNELICDFLINQDIYYFLRPILQPLEHLGNVTTEPLQNWPDTDISLSNSKFSAVHYHMEPMSDTHGLIMRIAYEDQGTYYIAYGYIVHDEPYLRSPIPTNYQLSMGLPYCIKDDLTPAWGNITNFVDDFSTPAQIDNNFINAQTYLQNNNIEDFLDDDYINLRFYYQEGDTYLRAYTIKQVLNNSNFFYLSNNTYTEINFTDAPSEYSVSAILNIVKGDDTTNSAIEKIMLSDPLILKSDTTEIDLELNIELKKYITENLPLISYYSITTTQVGRIDSSITNGTFWYQYHDKLDWPQIWEHAAVIETELETYWQTAYIASKNCEYFLPEHWQQSINGIVNYFNNAIIQTDGENVILNTDYVPVVEVVSQNGETHLPNYLLSRIENLKFKWTTTQEQVDTSEFHLPSAVLGSNQAIINVMQELGLATLDDNWTAENSGSTVYYYSNHGGTKWRDLIPKISMATTSSYSNLGGLYQMVFKYFNTNFINQEMDTYNKLVERQSSIWKRIYNLYPGIILESSYQNDSATTSADLYKMATYYFKDLSAPEKSYNIALLNADQLEGYQGNELHIGDSIKLNVFDYYQNTELSIYSALDQYLFITDMSYSLRTDHDLSLTVNNIKYQDKMIQRLAKLIQ